MIHFELRARRYPDIDHMKTVTIKAFLDVEGFSDILDRDTYDGFVSQFSADGNDVSEIEIGSITGLTTCGFIEADLKNLKNCLENFRHLGDMDVEAASNETTTSALRALSTFKGRPPVLFGDAEFIEDFFASTEMSFHPAVHREKIIPQMLIQLDMLISNEAHMFVMLEDYEAKTIPDIKAAKKEARGLGFSGFHVSVDLYESDDGPMPSTVILGTISADTEAKPLVFDAENYLDINALRQGVAPEGIEAREALFEP